MQDTMDLLFTIDDGYFPPLKVALYSLYRNNPGESFRVWLLYENLSDENINNLEDLCQKFDYDFQPIQIDGSQWETAPTISDRYPKEMYFRLLAADVLPKTLDKVLYLDPDILVLNPIRPLYNFDLGDKLLAAATHTGLVDVATPINKVRLDLDHGYFNSGVLLINLREARKKIYWQDIEKAIDKYGNLLLFPDQDILNHLYGKYAIEVPEEIWNYDARKYSSYYARSLREYDIHWVMENTVILHFCSQPKPWDDKHDNRFTALYITYRQMLDQFEKEMKAEKESLEI